jgi:hypothetical protein
MNLIQVKAELCDLAKDDVGCPLLQKADLAGCSINVRFAPENGRG